MPVIVIVFARSAEPPPAVWGAGIDHAARASRDCLEDLLQAIAGVLFALDELLNASSQMQFRHTGPEHAAPRPTHTEAPASAAQPAQAEAASGSEVPSDVPPKAMSQADGIRAARRRNLELLGLPPDRPHPSAAEVKKAYHQASLRVHPDKQVGKSPAEQRAAEEEFKLVAEARLFFSDIDEHLRALGLPPGSDPTQEQIDHAYWSVPHGPGSGADKALEFFQNLVSVEERIARERREPAQPPNVT